MEAAVGEEGLGLLLAEGIVALGDEFVEVEKRDVLVFGDIAGPVGVGVFGADDLAILPLVAGDEGAEDGGGVSGADIGDEVAEVPAVSVDGLWRAAVGACTFLSFFAGAFKGAGGA